MSFWLTGKPSIMILLPAHNERDCIEQVVSGIYMTDLPISVVVIDDNSSDGTSEMADDLARRYKNLSVIHRKGSPSLGRAYIEGFKYALKKDVDYIIQMDADLSHDPQYLPEMLCLAKEHDIILGSRYIDGVRVHNWSFKRLLLSKFANIFIRFMLKLPVEDSTSGFKCYRRKVLEALDLNRIKSNGYAFQIETLFWALKKGFKVHEMPIVFNERKGGVSKMSKAIAWEAFFRVLQLKFMKGT